MPPGPVLRFLPQGYWTTSPPGVELRRPSHGQLQSRPQVLLDAPIAQARDMPHFFYWIPAKFLVLRMSKRVPRILIVNMDVNGGEGDWSNNL